MGTPAAGQDPSSGMDEGADGGDQGVTVCITALSDGTFSVQIQESGSDDQSGEDESGDGPQSADNLDDALQLAGQMLQSEMSEEQGEGDATGDGDAALDPNQAKAAWNQMAAKRDRARAAG